MNKYRYNNVIIVADTKVEAISKAAFQKGYLTYLKKLATKYKVHFEMDFMRPVAIISPKTYDKLAIMKYGLENNKLYYTHSDGKWYGDELSTNKNEEYSFIKNLFPKVVKEFMAKKKIRDDKQASKENMFKNFKKEVEKKIKSFGVIAGNWKHFGRNFWTKDDIAEAKLTGKDGTDGFILNLDYVENKKNPNKNLVVISVLFEKGSSHRVVSRESFTATEGFTKKDIQNLIKKIPEFQKKLKK